MGVPERNATPQDHVEEAPRTAVARDEANEMSLTIWETIKANPKTIAYCLVLSLGPMTYGYELIVISLAVAMPSFQHVYGSLVGTSYILPSVWLALWSSMIQVGAMAGALINGAIADRFGRKVTFIGGATIAVGSIFIVYFSDQVDTADSKRVMFLMGKIVAGFAFGLMNTSFLTIISEIAPTRVRGPLLSCFTFFTIVGQIAAVSLVYVQIPIIAPSSYRTVFASQWGLAGVAIVAGLIVPESPVFWIKRNNLAKALRAYKRLYSSPDPEASLSALQNVIEHEVLAQKNNESGSYIQCFKGTNWRRTRIIIYANIMQQLVGITMITNSTYFLELGGMAASLALQLNVVHLGVGLPSSSIWTSCMTVLWLSMGIAGCFPSNKTALLFIGVILIVIYEFYALGVGSVYPVVAAESSNMQLRAASQSIGFFANFVCSWLFAFTVPYMFNVDAGNLGGKCGFIFSGFSLIGFLIVWFEIPETKNRTYAELDEMFEKKLPTRAFKNYVCTGIEERLTKTDQGAA